MLNGIFGRLLKMLCCSEILQCAALYQSCWAVIIKLAAELQWLQQHPISSENQASFDISHPRLARGIGICLDRYFPSCWAFYVDLSNFISVALSRICQPTWLEYVSIFTWSIVRHLAHHLEAFKPRQGPGTQPAQQLHSKCNFNFFIFLL